MTKLFDQKAILAKIEDTYATDASPVAANAILATNGRWEPIAGSTVSRNLEQPYQGGQEEVRTNVHAILTFDVELAGAGAAGANAGAGAGAGVVVAARGGVGGECAL